MLRNNLSSVSPGMNFYSILNFFPLLLQYYYKPDPILLGERAMGYGFSILFGASGVSFAMAYTNGRVREVITFSCVVMTALTGALAAATPFNPGFAVAMSTVGGSKHTPSQTIRASCNLLTFFPKSALAACSSHQPPSPS